MINFIIMYINKIDNFFLVKWIKEKIDQIIQTKIMKIQLNISIFKYNHLQHKRIKNKKIIINFKVKYLQIYNQI